jgi:hypothetical protein
MRVQLSPAESEQIEREDLAHLWLRILRLWGVWPPGEDDALERAVAAWEAVARWHRPPLRAPAADPQLSPALEAAIRAILDAADWGADR